MHDLIRYVDRSRKDLGLIRGEFYEKIPSDCVAAVRVRTSTNLIIYCPVDWFKVEEKKKRLSTGITLKRTGRFEFQEITGHLADKRFYREIFLPFIHITIINEPTTNIRR